MATPVSVPDFLLRRQLLSAGRLLAVLYLKQKILALMTYQ
jgi:hypothetical protein